MTKPLIVGGKGYIGSLLAEETGWDVTDLPTRCCDVEPPDVVVYLAGTPSVEECEKDPQSSWNNNVLEFNQLARKCKKLVFVSTMHVYGGGLDRREDEQPVPTNFLGKQKLVAETACKHFATILRFGIVCGKSPTMRWTTLVNKMVKDAKETGRVFACGLEFWRPLLGVSDATAAIRAVVEGGCERGLYNVVSNNLRVAIAARYVAESVGAKLEVGDDASVGISMDPMKFRLHFGFEPKCNLQSVVEELL